MHWNEGWKHVTGYKGAEVRKIERVIPRDKGCIGGWVKWKGFCLCRLVLDPRNICSGTKMIPRCSSLGSTSSQAVIINLLLVLSETKEQFCYSTIPLFFKQLNLFSTTTLGNVYRIKGKFPTPIFNFSNSYPEVVLSKITLGPA